MAYHAPNPEAKCNLNEALLSKPALYGAGETDKISQRGIIRKKLKRKLHGRNPFP